MQSMTPSVVEESKMTNEQVDKAADNFRAALRKHRSEFTSSAVQQALGTAELVSDLLSVFRKRVETFSNLITRCVRVDRTRTPEEAIRATDRKQYTNGAVVKAMPKGEGELTEVIFFNLGRFVNDDALEQEYELRGLKPADPHSLAAVNEADPAFADEHPNGTHWKDADGKWCYAAFNRWHDGRSVGVRRDGIDWHDYWWFGGLRK